MNNLVYEQGTMVDRIDFNILQAQTNVEKANRLLEKRVDYEEGRG
jgi:t-SNARE complex subunit (syntaxin)